VLSVFYTCFEIIAEKKASLKKIHFSANNSIKNCGCLLFSLNLTEKIKKSDIDKCDVLYLTN
ncbi:hypothetical protein M153_5230003, partial [Pseudoloma neurophilia]